MLREAAIMGLFGLGAYLFWWRRRAAPEGQGSGQPARPVTPTPKPAPKPQAVAVPHAAIVQLAARINRDHFGGRADLAGILAIIEVESAFNPRAHRFEPHLGEASYGLMQLLLSTARDRGYSGAPDGLYDPATNIRLGIAQLEWGEGFLRSRLGRAPTINESIGAYNAGVGNILKGYVPLGYVQKWASARGRWQARLAGAAVA